MYQSVARNYTWRFRKCSLSVTAVPNLPLVFTSAAGLLSLRLARSLHRSKEGGREASLSLLTIFLC